MDNNDNNKTINKSKIEEMRNDGFKFYLSKNKVWLTKEVPVKYLVKGE